MIAQPAPPPERPNIVIILADDLGYADAFLPGSPLAALAERSVRFTRGYAAAPVCAPSRLGLLTGRTPASMGRVDNPRGRDYWPRDATCLAQMLKTAGYETACIGKWHLGSLTGQHPLDLGFDRFYGFLGGWTNYYAPFPADPARKIIDQRTVTTPEINLTDKFGVEARRWIRTRSGDNPFFLYLAFNAPHTPLQPARDAPRPRTKRDAYLAMVNRMAFAIDGVLQTLPANTLVFFASDNGGAKNNASDNTPLRGHKASLWEGGIRVPMLAYWPEQLQPGEYTSPVSLLDVVPTVMAVADQYHYQPSNFHGKNLLTYLQHSTPINRTLRWTWRGKVATVDGDWKSIGTRTYDLAADPQETGQ